jgi:fatty acid desaturase
MATGYRTHDHNGTPNPLGALSDEQLAEIGRELDALHDEVKADLGDRDAAYINGIIALQRRLALLGRVELFASRWRPAWIAGTTALSVAKILENMEIGHNVLHGQWDWMNHPVINSQTWDWDTASTSEAWKHSHNYIHHTFTNILGKDRDLGYEIMRIDSHQPWHPVYLLQPITNVLLMMLFEWGVAVHDLDFTAIRAGEKSMKKVRQELKGIAAKGRMQIQKDYVAWQAPGRPCLAPARAAPRPAVKQRRLHTGLQGLVPGHGQGQRHGERGPQRLVQRDHLLRSLPGSDVRLQ